MSGTELQSSPCPRYPHLGPESQKLSSKGRRGWGQTGIWAGYAGVRATTKVRGLMSGGRGCSPRSRESTHPPPAARFPKSHWAESPSVSRPSQVPLLLEVLSDPQGWGVAAPFLLPAADAIIPASLTRPRPRPCSLVTAAVGGQDLVCESWSARALTPARLGGLTPPIALPLL